MTILYRKYKSYEEYLEHQSSKFGRMFKNKSEKVRPEFFKKRVKKFIKVMEKISKYIGDKNKNILCAGARNGAEVKSLKKLHFKNVIGIDINPGRNNKYVIKGDFNHTCFNDNAFDVIYSNCIDHVWDIKLFSLEMNRILKNKGILILEVPQFFFKYNQEDAKNHMIGNKNKYYESFFCDNFEDIKQNLLEFKLIEFLKEDILIAIFENIKK
jgi:SAM-dependent methyltransferase